MGKRVIAAASAGQAAALQQLIVADPVVDGGDGLRVRLGGRLMPLLMERQIVRAFLPGWRAVLLHTGFAPLFLLELAHDDGREATWFLDCRMQRIGDDLDRIGPEALALLRQKAMPVLQRLLGNVLEECTPTLEADGLAFLRLNAATRVAIALLCRDAVLPRPALLLSDMLADAPLIYRDRVDRSLRAIDPSQLAAGFAVSWQDRLPDAFRSGAIAWPSPVDGATLHAQGCVCIDDFHFAYRFADRRHGLVFFVLIGDHFSTAGGIWFPGLGLIVAGPEERTRGVAGLQLLPHLSHWITTHVAVWAGLLVPYLNAGPRRFASVLRGRASVHIGHQLWNELSGIDHLLANEPGLAAAGLLPHWIVLDADAQTELYGAIDALYPALRGRVRRDLEGTASLIRHTYESGTMMLRVTSEHVSQHLRQRILKGPAVRAAAADVAAQTRGRRLVILLGLRVENRTLVDVAGFFERLAGCIAERHPDAVLVLDGHNARADGALIESHGESRAARSPADVEHDLAAQLRRRFERHRLRIVATIGQPIAVSLAWAARCDCFVSIWGASLAKYRWVCNKPGFVVTSRHNLIHRRDLHIYDAPDFMESPTRLVFANPELVQDRPDAPRLVDVSPGQASFFNFELDEAALFPHITELIDSTLS